MARMLCLLLLVLAAPVQADIYRWVDERGVVHFSDRTPVDREAESIPVEPPPSLSPERRKALDRERKALLGAADKRQRAAAHESKRAAKARARERRKMQEWRAQCSDTRALIAEIESELRSGYSISRGERLHRKLERLREREASQCR